MNLFAGRNHTSFYTHLTQYEVETPWPQTDNRREIDDPTDEPHDNFQPPEDRDPPPRWVLLPNGRYTLATPRHRVKAPTLQADIDKLIAVRREPQSWR